MNMRINKERGFSLPELIVVVGILGVLTAVSLVSYRGYIDSTRKSVTESNAKTLYKWFYDVQSRRKTGIEVNPHQCLPAVGTALNCVLAMTSTYGPFKSITSPYRTDRGPSYVLRPYTPDGGWTYAADHDRTACPNNFLPGDILIEIAANAPVDTIYEIWYCAKDFAGNAKLYTRHGWHVVW